MADELRVIDFGPTSPLRSQTLWHAVARGVDLGQPPTLSFTRTTSPYVSIGFHRSAEELDRDTCSRRGWPILRRMVGGGPVYMDPHQLCFQISVPAARLPARRSAATRYLLEPALQAFRAAGLQAELDGTSEVVVGDRKVCGHAAAQIGSAVVLVGNLIERFDHVAAASILDAPDAAESRETLRLMRRYVAFDPSGPRVDAAAFVAAATAAYGEAMGAQPRAGRLCAEELQELERLDRRFADPSWVAGPDRRRSAVWKTKIRSGVWRYFVRGGGGRVGLSVVGGRIEAARVEGSAHDARITEILTGAMLAEAPARASGLGPAAMDVSAYIEQLVEAARSDFALVWQEV